MEAKVDAGAGDFHLQVGVLCPLFWHKNLQQKGVLEGSATSFVFLKIQSILVGIVPLYWGLKNKVPVQFFSELKRTVIFCDSTPQVIPV